MNWLNNINETINVNKIIATVVEILKRENECYKLECTQIKVAMGDIKIELSSVNTQQNNFEEKIELLTENLKINLIEKQGLLKR